MDSAPLPSPRLAEFTELLRARRSVRRYRARPVDRHVLQDLLDAAVAAPSAHNRQPWRFAVLESLHTRSLLARAMGERLRADRTRDGDSGDAVDADVARSFARITGAAAVIVVCLTMIDMDRYPDDRRAAAERTMATQGVAMAAQNILLSAHVAGLAACWMCAPLFCPDTVTAALALPADWEPQAIITLGYPDDAGKPHRRRAPSELTRWQDGPA